VAVDRSTHLLIRSVVRVKDENTGQQREDATIFTNYRPNGGVQVPMQVTGSATAAASPRFFYDSCQINPPLPADYLHSRGGWSSDSKSPAARSRSNSIHKFR